MAKPHHILLAESLARAKKCAINGIIRLEKASVEQNILPFAKFLLTEMTFNQQVKE